MIVYKEKPVMMLIHYQIIEELQVPAKLLKQFNKQLQIIIIDTTVKYCKSSIEVKKQFLIATNVIEYVTQFVN
jgi:trehalose-6-phosphatase